MDILKNTKLQFLHISKTHHMHTNTVNFLDNPRPFFCMGMILKGGGRFCSENSEDVCVLPGDIILVPMTSTYISHWTGSPDILYISFHFSFENELTGYIPLQKISGCENLKEGFEFAYDNFSAANQQFKILSIFYDILNEISPKIKIYSEKPISISASVQKAIDYIVFNYTNEIQISTLAKIANLSPSRFFAVFKKETGSTPIEYKNRILIRNAEKMLLTTDLSIEEISEKLGFNSSSYFRRTFKSFTGKSPRDYKISIKSDWGL